IARSLHRLSSISALVCLLPLLHGCGRAGGDEPVTVTIWSAPKGVEEAGFKRLCARFEKEHSGIRVRNTGSLQEDKLIRAIVAGAPPDLAYLYGTSDLGPLAANHALVPLDERFNRAGLREDLFLPVAIAQGRYAGHLYAMPVTRDCYGMYWNKAVFRK